MRAPGPDAPRLAPASRLLGVALTCLATVPGCRGNFDVPEQPDGPGPDASEQPLPAVLRGCQLYLKMEEESWGSARGATQARDACGDDDPATSLAAVVASDPTRGRVGFFAGNAALLVPDSPRLRGGSAVSLSAWVRPTGTVGEPPSGIIAKRTSFGVKAAYTMFLWTGAHMWADIDMENERIDVPVRIESDRWVHLAMVYDGGAAMNVRVRTYINGALVGAFPESSTSIPASYDAPLTIGHLPDASDPNLYFRGMIDDVVVWNRALADAEIDEWYRLTKLPP
jgi:hypothetical protein